jgi:hypothetical protein
MSTYFDEAFINGKLVWLKAGWLIIKKRTGKIYRNIIHPLIYSVNRKQIDAIYGMTTNTINRMMKLGDEN